MSLTRAKKLHATVWGVLVVLWVFAKSYGPIKNQPWQGIGIALCVVLLIALLLLETGLGVEKPDERANANGYKANSLLFNVLNGALVLYILFGKEMRMPFCSWRCSMCFRIWRFCITNAVRRDRHAPDTHQGTARCAQHGSGAAGGTRRRAPRDDRPIGKRTV